jgi:hypothetical protein
MQSDCGANKEPVMRRRIVGISLMREKETGGVAGLPQPPDHSFGPLLAALPAAFWPRLWPAYFLTGADAPGGSLK